MALENTNTLAPSKSRYPGKRNLKEREVISGCQKKERTQAIVVNISGNIGANITGNGTINIDNRVINNTYIVNNTRNSVRKNTVALGIGDSFIRSLANIIKDAL